VVIATNRRNTHVDYLNGAPARAPGKAIYCEKPIGLDYREAEKSGERGSGDRRPGDARFSNRRFDTSHAAVKQAVEKR